MFVNNCIYVHLCQGTNKIFHHTQNEGTEGVVFNEQNEGKWCHNDQQKSSHINKSVLLIGNDCFSFFNKCALPKIVNNVTLNHDQLQILT